MILHVPTSWQKADLDVRGGALHSCALEEAMEVGKLIATDFCHVGSQQRSRECCSHDCQMVTSHFYCDMDVAGRVQIREESMRAGLWSARTP